jgi:16S rRNA (guanine(966)-N(2))-methyltransferase RsmD
MQFELTGRRVLDLFAGSGQMGLEALSRGASAVTFADASPDAIAIVKENARRCGFFDRCRYLIGDYRNVIRKAGDAQYDLIFIDPPYALRAVAPTLKALLDAEMLKPTSIVVCESEESDIFESDATLGERFEILKRAKYGMAHMTIVKPLI